MGAELKQERPLLSVADSLDELARLANTAGLEVVGRATQRFDQPNPATYIGAGKVEEVKMLVEEMQQFFFEMYMSMADTYMNATNNKEHADKMKSFAREFGKEVNLIK